MSPATFEGPGEECAGVFAFLPMQHPSLSVTALITFLLLLLLSACGGNEGSRNGESDPEMSDLDRIEQRIIATPNDPALFAERARLNEERDSLRLAFNDWSRALALDSNRSEFHLGIGDLYFGQVRLEKAEEHLRKAAMLDQASAEARLKLAEIELLQRNYKEAMGWANDALRIDQQHARGYFLKGWIHMEAGDTALAVSSFRTAVEQDPDMYEAFVQLGVLHAAAGDPLAMQYYTSALDVRPNDTDALYGLAMFAQENGMDSLALACYDRMKEIDPRNALPWYNSGYVLLELKDRPAEAREQFTGAIARSPTFPEAYFNRGLTFEREGRPDSAVIDYQRTLALRPDYTPAAEALDRLQARGVRVKR